MAYAAILKIVLSLYLSRKSSDFNKIWYADCTSNVGYLTKYHNFANLKWRTAAILTNVDKLQFFLHFLSICEAELDWLDMRINRKKSSCIRFGARFGVQCSNISTSDDSKLPWSDNFRYLGVYLRSSRSFACSFSHTKHSLYRAFNAVFGKVG